MNRYPFATPVSGMCYHVLTHFPSHSSAIEDQVEAEFEAFKAELKVLNQLKVVTSPHRARVFTNIGKLDLLDRKWGSPQMSTVCCLNWAQTAWRCEKQSTCSAWSHMISAFQEKKRQANRALACGATRKKRRRPWWRWAMSDATQPRWAAGAESCSSGRDARCSHHTEPLGTRGGQKDLGKST